MKKITIESLVARVARVSILILIMVTLTACGATSTSEANSHILKPDLVTVKPELTQAVSEATPRIKKTIPAGQPQLSDRSYVVKGRRYHILATAEGFEEEGISTWYGPGFHGRKTASGEKFNQNALTAAHKTLPLGSIVEVTNNNNGKKVVVRINDRGPFGARKYIIDLSKKAARSIGITGIAPVSIRVMPKKNI